MRLGYQIKGYIESFPNADIVVVEGNREDRFRVTFGYDIGNVDRATAEYYATELIYDILDANRDCSFQWIYITCTNGKSPIGGLIAQYEDDEFRFLS